MNLPKLPGFLRATVLGLATALLAGAPDQTAVLSSDLHQVLDAQIEQLKAQQAIAAAAVAGGKK